MMQESGRRSEARGRLLPDLLPFAVERAEEEAEVALRTQVPDGEPDAGGYRSPDTLVCDSKAVAKTARLLARLWLEPSSKFHRSDALVDSVRRAMRFFEYRAQQPDGSTHGLPTGDMGSAPHAAFAVEAFHELLPVWARVDHPARREVEMAVRRCMVRAGVALRSKGVFTHNHRWIACAALACINDIAPDARLVARIDDYLSDGIDQDEDGFWSEYSPVYAMLSNICYTRMADLLDRPELLEPVWRNLDTLPFLRHSNGEVACEFTFRQDRGAVQNVLGGLELEGAAHLVGVDDARACTADLGGEPGVPEEHQPLALVDPLLQEVHACVRGRVVLGDRRLLVARLLGSRGGRRGKGQPRDRQ